MGNVTNYKYDGLHRMSRMAHPSGSYASITPDRCVVYDSATVHGVSMSNAKDHLAEAYTVLGLGFKDTDAGSVILTRRNGGNVGIHLGFR